MLAKTKIQLTNIQTTSSKVSVPPFYSILMDDLLEELETDQLSLLNSIYTDTEAHGCGNHVATAQELTLHKVVLLAETEPYSMVALKSAVAKLDPGPAAPPFGLLLRPPKHRAFSVVSTSGMPPVASSA